MAAAPANFDFQSVFLAEIVIYTTTMENVMLSGHVFLQSARIDWTI